MRCNLLGTYKNNRNEFSYGCRLCYYCIVQITTELYDFKLNLFLIMSMLYLYFESPQPVALFSYFFRTHYSTHEGLLCVYTTPGQSAQFCYAHLMVHSIMFYSQKHSRVSYKQNECALL